MELHQKFRADLEKIDLIESKFFRDLIGLLYSLPIQHELIPMPLTFYFQTEENMELLLTWFHQHQHLSIPSQEKYLPLGKYAETLLLFFLENHPHFQLLEHNLQLNDDKTTIGELDYLFAIPTNNMVVHLELAIKFYLKVNLKGEEVYLGPSTKDWMKRKLAKLMSHQLPLPHQRKDLLPDSLQTLAFTSQLYLKGALFLPFSEWKTKSRNPWNHGWWITVEELESVLLEAHEYSIITNKTNWIFPFNSRIPLYRKEEVILRANRMLQERNEIMLCRFDEGRKALDRGFVMRSNWPH